MTDRHEIRLCGFGGQGIMLAGYIIGQAASIFENKDCVFTRDYGPEARGGSCRADVVVSDKRVLYPYIDNPSILVAMSQQAHDKYCSENREDSLIIIDKELVKHREKRTDRLLAIPARRIAEELGNIAVANVVMLGFFTAATDIVSKEAMKESIKVSVPKHTVELNMEAFEQGFAYRTKV